MEKMRRTLSLIVLVAVLAIVCLYPARYSGTIGGSMTYLTPEELAYWRTVFPVYEDKIPNDAPDTFITVQRITGGILLGTLATNGSVVLFREAYVLVHEVRVEKRASLIEIWWAQIIGSKLGGIYLSGGLRFEGM